MVRGPFDTFHQSPFTIANHQVHTDAIVVLTTVASEDEAVKLVRTLLERRLIACGTLLPGARSLYRWQSKIADEREVVVLLKTRSARLDSLQSAFGELHPYKVPELLALPVSAGLGKYLEWIKGEVYANVYQTDRIARINPATGKVTGWIDLTGLLGPADRVRQVDVLNGIAYDARTDRLFVTGKWWPKLFEIKLVKKSQ